MKKLNFSKILLALTLSQLFSFGSMVVAESKNGFVPTGNIKKINNQKKPFNATFQINSKMWVNW
jgi:hypothetical protein